MVEEDIAWLRRRAEHDLHVPAKLHDYQWEGIAFLFRSRAALLADEMGLGKTVQAAVAISLLLDRDPGFGRALIVAPAALTINWVQEITRWAPAVTVRMVTGDVRNREAYYLLPIPVLVASYEQIRSDSLDRIPPDTFDLVVLDEAQRIKNRNSTTAFASRLLPRKRAWALSATPLENHEKDLASILSFLSPGLPVELGRRDIASQLASLMLRRRKQEVRAELPSVLIQDLPIALADVQRARYDSLWYDRASQLRSVNSREEGATLLALITKLKLVCNYDRLSNTSSKLEALRAVIDGAGDDGRVLVFSQFVDTLQWVASRLDVEVELLTGATAPESREKVIDTFNRGPSPRALLVSLRAGGVGLNLGEATHVVLFDRWWNPAVEIQAIFRAHRFDRNSPLHVIRFLTAGTIEERINAILQAKGRLFADVVESVETSAAPFTREELLQILEIHPEDFPRHKQPGDIG
jgi:SNF2 family DNA or RNA helicase